MKKLVKLLGIITLVLIIGLSMMACDFGDSDDSDNSGSGGNGGGGGSGGNPTITINNNASQDFVYGYRKPSSSTDWGSDILTSRISSGQSRAITFPVPLSTENVYDFIFTPTSGTNSGNIFAKYGITITNGMTLTFTNSDLNDGSSLPSITIQNRSGVNFNSVYIKPSSTENWNRNFGSLSNNSNMSVTIPIPPSNYTVFDIQMRTTDPTVPGTFTKTNVAIINSMIVTFDSTDADGENLNLPVIIIQNNASQDFVYGYRKPSSSTDWGSDILTSRISSGQSRAIALPVPLSTENVYDFLFSPTSGTTSGNNFVKYGETITNGMTLTFTNSDLNNGSSLPSITIQNRTGINFNSVYIKPSSTEEWNRNFGSLSNNNNMPITIPIPPSNYTVFDIQMRTTDPTVPGTFTKNSMTITNGTVVTFVSTDADGLNNNLPVIVIQNNTSQDFVYGYRKPSSSVTWSSDILTSRISSGQSRAIALPVPLSTENVYDFLFSPTSGTTSGNNFAIYGTVVTNGMTLTFANSDLQ